MENPGLQRFSPHFHWIADALVAGGSQDTNRRHETPKCEPNYEITNPLESRFTPLNPNSGVVVP